MGEWSCTTIAHGKKNNIKLIAEQRFPHSIGFLYSSFTQYLGFKVDSGEYKLMGLAPYGEPKFDFLNVDKMINQNFAELLGNYLEKEYIKN